MMVFYLVCFAFSISYSVLPFHLDMFSNLTISFFIALSQVFIKVVDKLLYVCVCVCVCVCMHVYIHAC